MKNIFIISLLIVLLIACAGTEPSEPKDKPPTKPVLIPHLGSVGDIRDTLNTDDLFTDQNNGFDSISDIDGIRLQWEPLTDRNLQSIEIWRFAKYLDPNPVRIDVIYDWTKTEYDDRLVDTGVDTPYYVDWYYYITAVNRSGLSTESDTTYFQLLEKPTLNHPANNRIYSYVEVNSLDSLEFKWTIPNTLFTHMRLLIFELVNDEQILKVYHDDYPIGDPDFEIKYTSIPNAPNLERGDYMWRVDLKGREDYEGNFFSGSKSLSRRFVIR